MVPTCSDYSFGVKEFYVVICVRKIANVKRLILTIFIVKFHNVRNPTLCCRLNPIVHYLKDSLGFGGVPLVLRRWILSPYLSFTINKYTNVSSMENRTHKESTRTVITKFKTSMELFHDANVDH